MQKVSLTSLGPSALDPDTETDLDQVVRFSYFNFRLKIHSTKVRVYIKTKIQNKNIYSR